MELDKTNIVNNGSLCTYLEL